MLPLTFGYTFAGATLTFDRRLSAVLGLGFVLLFFLLPRWIERYGPDTILLIGGSLYRQDDLTDATRRLVRKLRG